MPLQKANGISPATEALGVLLQRLALAETLRIPPKGGVETGHLDAAGAKGLDNCIDVCASLRWVDFSEGQCVEKLDLERVPLYREIIFIFCFRSESIFLPNTLILA